VKSFLPGKSGVRPGDQGNSGFEVLFVGWFWFLGSLIPMIGLVQVGFQAMADRYAYISFIGLFLMLIWFAADWAKARQIFAPVAAIPAVFCLLVLGSLTHRQVAYWHDAPSFWSHTLAVTQDNYIAHDSLGDFLLTHGHADEAAEHFRAAVAIRPDDLAANLNLANYENARGNFPAAIEHYEKVAAESARMGLPAASLQASACLKLGTIYRRTADFTKATDYFEKILRLVPNQPQALIGLGLIAEKTGNLPEAARDYSRAIAAEPSDVGYLLLAHALQLEGKLDESKAAYALAARSSNLAEAQKAAMALLSGK
jgi:protein O-mannosyl-transferase